MIYKLKKYTIFMSGAHGANAPKKFLPSNADLMSRDSNKSPLKVKFSHVFEFELSYHM